ncbi:hypothetical protein L1987_55703 [Smallanthus sonchifolius]|uniref:Uncharacterized protein n=1 Tax=Smallanthus sonchifolius TaxID=185202 RepID=A0ACB9EAC3_9ASTR|nr:hypothetical protein L1987_55703 [Smallanthus sonchifolius]
MTGASSRLLFILTNPSSLLHQLPIILFRLARRHSTTFPFTTLSAAAPNHHHRQNSLIPPKFCASFYSRGTNYAFQENNYHVPPSHPGPEWSRLIETLSVAGYSNGNSNSNIEDEFMANENLSKEFVAAANSCLAFARDRPEILGWLPRNDIEVMINDGYPLLFKSAHETERRMRYFLQTEGSDEATSVDLMKYILSYASNPERNIKEATESSVRSMLQEISNLINRGRASEQYEQMPRNLGPNITMKRGDWICTKCNFMNFARNTKCLECEEPRPQRQMTDGEWDCPRCNFFNYRRNTVCLKCECGRPDAAPLHGSNSGYVPSRHTQDTDKEDKTERWFKKVKELHGVTGPKNDISHDFPQIMPIHKEEKGLLDNKSKDQPFPPYQGTSSGFVPFPPDYFAKKDKQQQPNSIDSTIKPTNEIAYRNPNNATFDQNLVQETRNQFRLNEPKSETAYVSQQIPENMNGKSRCAGKSLEGSAVTEPDPLDMSEEAKAERWFKRVAQIKDISELSQIPDEDFPSIMPMRKGVNRFVVSKRKTPLERRLTSPQYRKNLRIMSSDPMKKEDD